jgi:DNA-binding protein HU-beta
MNKPEIIESISKKSGLSKADSAKALEAFVETVVDAMESDDEVNLTGFTKFYVSSVAERKGHNPKDGTTIVIPAHKTVRVRVGKGLKNSVK